MGPRQLSRGIYRRLDAIARHMAASMGPRQLSRGITASERVRCFRQVGFNGATAIEPWNRESRGPDRLRQDGASMGPRQLSRGILRGACVGRRASTASMGPRQLSRGINFNGELQALVEDASMGPRQLSRGIFDDVAKRINDEF